MPLLTIKQIMADSVRLATTDADPKDRYAVGAFNFSTIPEMVGLVEGAREKNAPVILMASIGAVKYIGSLDLAGLPGISVPCGVDSKGLPIGMQLIGDCFKENNIIRAAYAYEQTRTYERCEAAKEQD